MDRAPPRDLRGSLTRRPVPSRGRAKVSCLHGSDTGCFSESDSNRFQYSNTLISLNDRVADGIQAAASRRDISLTLAI
jgi:hypothetical protein